MNTYGPEPRSVQNQNGVHYFFWRWDAYKPFDYEPLMVYKSEKTTVVLSRFHWHVATIWTRPILSNGRPSVCFVEGTHTPIVESKSYEWKYVEIENGIPFSERVKLTFLYLPAFNKVLTRRSFQFKKGYDYSNRLSDGGVPARYLFNLKDINAAVVIGNMFKPDEIPDVIRERFWGK